MRVDRAVAARASGSVVLVVVLSIGAAARAQPIQDPSGVTPQSPQSQWPRFSDEELRPPPPPQAKAPEAPEPPPPVEPSAPRFGAPGELVATGDSSIGVSSTEFSKYDASAFSVAFSPGLDLFVVRGLSIGVDVNLGYSSTRSYGADGKLVSATRTTAAVGSRLGLDVPLGELASWYPRVTVGVESVRLEVHDAQTSSFDPRPSRSNDTGLFLSAFAPLLLHPKPHFFVGVGPSVFHAFGGPRGGPQIGVERTTVSARFVIGGWWGGSPPAAEPRATPPPSNTPLSTPPRFGASGQWVFTGELGGGISSTETSGVGASTVVSFVPGFDYFVGRRVSLGASATGYRAKTIVTTPQGNRTTTDASLLAIGVRIGIDQPLSSFLSFYPRASLSVGRDSFDERSGSKRNDASSTVVTLSLFAPVLVHVATHAFLGFGPYIAHDAVRETGKTRVDNLGTRIGASLVVGGWL